MLRARLHGTCYTVRTYVLITNMMHEFDLSFFFFYFGNKFYFIFFPQNMEKSAKSIKSQELRSSFLGDLNKLSEAGSEECFDKIVILFKEKWDAEESATVALNHLVW